MIGSSGTIKAVKIALAYLDAAPKDQVTLEGVFELKRHLIEVGHCDDIDLEGVKAHRKAIFAAGVAILIAVMQVFGIKRMSYSDGALREGVMYDMLSRSGDNDVRELSVQELLSRFGIDKKQAKRVMKTSRVLFAEAKEGLLLHEQEGNLLKWAGLLHEIGMAIGHSGYHRHSAYIIEHAEIAGFSRPDQLQMSMLVRYHRRKVSEDDRILVHKVGGEKLVFLCLLLRLAVGINHARTDFSKTKIALRIISYHHWQLIIDKNIQSLAIPILHSETTTFAKWGVALEVVMSD